MSLRHNTQYATVVEAYGTHLTVQLDPGPQNPHALIPAVLRGRLKRERQDATRVVTIGDRVEVSLLPDGSGAVEAILPRTSLLTRPGFRGRTQLIAANLDRLYIVLSTTLPEFNELVLDRLLILGAQADIPAHVLLGKVDAAPAERVDALQHVVAARNVPVTLISARSGIGLDAVRDAAQGCISALIGPSGVGKTSLVLALFPELAQRYGDSHFGRTQSVSSDSGQGRHTTTAARLHPLPDGGYLADTPGLREIATWALGGPQEAQLFPQIVEIATECRFRDCTHVHEPGCAVKSAVESGRLAREDYERHLALTTRAAADERS